MEKKLKVLVVAGGTKVKIDDVRYIGNFSTGRFGVEIARHFARHGASVHLLASEKCLRHFGERCVPIEHVDQFVWFEELEESLPRIVAAQQPDIVVMAAAVSDFLYANPVEGKISSDVDEFSLPMKKAPKLISRLREQCDPGTFIIGFKLKAKVGQDELLAAARKLRTANHLNMVVANLKDEIDDDHHPITFVTPEGGAIRVDGNPEKTSAALVDFALKRHWTRRLPTRHHCLMPDTSTTQLMQQKAAQLLTFAVDSGLFTDSPDGNLSVARYGAASNRLMVVTPRGLPKSKLTAADLMLAEVVPYKLVKVPAEVKPSVDTGMQSWLYTRFPWIDAMLHFHDAFIIPSGEGTAVTEFPYPCGTIEEAEEVCRALVAARDDERRIGGKDCLVKLVHHGYLLLLELDGIRKLCSDWFWAKTSYLQHLKEVGEAVLGSELLLRPIFHRASIVGIIASRPNGEYSSVFLLPEHRGGGLGALVTDELARRKIRVKAKDDCKVTDYYKYRGWRQIAREGAFVLLEPPTLRTDVREAATVCLFKPSTDEVLMGERLFPPMKGYWCFPGGRTEPGESARTAGWREFSEEVRAEVPPGAEPAFETEMFVGHRDDDRCYRVHTFVIPVEAFPDYHGTIELDPRAVRIDYALSSLPLLQGTKRVLHMLKEYLSKKR